MYFRRGLNGKTSLKIQFFWPRKTKLSGRLLEFISACVYGLLCRSFWDGMNAHPVQTLYNYVLGESVFGRTVLELAIYYALAFM